MICILVTFDAAFYYASILEGTVMYTACYNHCKTNFKMLGKDFLKVVLEIERTWGKENEVVCTHQF